MLNLLSYDTHGTKNKTGDSVFYTVHTNNRLIITAITKKLVSFRFGLPRPGNPKELTPKDATAAQRAPVFLLFLDCVWQLLQQFPAHFQFSETYLTTLWDCAHNHIFDTFLFNCARDRELAVTKVCFSEVISIFPQI